MTTYRLLFSGDDASGDAQLWSSDGTDIGTAPLLVSDASPTGLQPSYLTALQSVTLFQGVAADGATDLWSTDGSAAGTEALTVAGAQSDAQGGLSPTDIVQFGAGALFAGFDAAGAQQLWVTYGAGATTHELSFGGFEAFGTFPENIVSLGTKAVFNEIDAAGLAQLGATDGTAAGTLLLAPKGASAQGLDPVDISAFKKLGLFFGTDAKGTEGLWKTNGTQSGTTEIAAMVGDPNNLSTAFVTLGSVAVFAGIGSDGRDELLSTGGASVATLRPAGASADGLDPTDITAFGAKALFAGVNAAGDDGLWITDGTAAGTKELSSAAAGVQPIDIVSLGSKALFSLQTAAGPELFVTDGTSGGTHEVTVAGAYPLGLTPTDITAFGAGAVFEGADAEGSTQLYTYDAATGKTAEVASAAGALGEGPDFTVAPSVQCFMPGALIRTPGGQTPVEALRVGDLVETGLGRGARRVRWIGRRRIDAGRHPHPELVWPFRVRADAFGPGAPARDLMLSPDHAVKVGGRLVPVRLLANGMTIAQEKVRRVDYLHVELDGHDVLFAEGLPVESYLDDGTRAQFEGGASLSLHPDFSSRRPTAHACLPVSFGEAEVRPLWRAAARRAQLLGFGREHLATTLDAGLSATARGVLLSPVETGPRVLSFALPSGARRVRLVSRSAAPCDARPWLDDRRRLGVQVARLVASSAKRETELALDGPALRAGWHAAECCGAASWRWTDGNATIAVAASVRRLDVHLAGEMVYAASATVEAPRRRRAVAA